VTINCYIPTTVHVFSLALNSSCRAHNLSMYYFYVPGLLDGLYHRWRNRTRRFYSGEGRTFIHSGKHVACYHIASLLFQYLGGYRAMGGQWFLGDFIFHVLIVIFLLFFIRPFVLNSHVIYCLSSFFVVILS